MGVARKPQPLCEGLGSATRLAPTPQWHSYSDPVAMTFADPRGQIEETWKARMTLLKGKAGLWTQVEIIENYFELGEAAFRKIGMEGPQRTITFFAPSVMEDYWEHNSEVPLRPFPEEKRREPQGRTDWSEDDREEEEDME